MRACSVQRSVFSHHTVTGFPTEAPRLTNYLPLPLPPPPPTGCGHYSRLDLADRETLRGMIITVVRETMNGGTIIAVKGSIMAQKVLIRNSNRVFLFCFVLHVAEGPHATSIWIEHQSLRSIMHGVYLLIDCTSSQSTVCTRQCLRFPC